MKFWAARTKAKHDVDVEWDRAVSGLLADGYNVYYGARSIKHEVERQIVGRLALAHELQRLEGQSVVKFAIDANGDLKMSVRGRGKDEEELVELEASMLNSSLNM